MHINLHFLHHHHHDSVTHSSTGSKERLINPRTFSAIPAQVQSSPPPPVAIDVIRPQGSKEHNWKNSITLFSQLKMNDWDLQSDRTASGESDLSISEWFHHLITPPSERNVPELFDGTAHLVEKRDRRRAAFL
ncbi:hypothetical protein PCASD_08781 [Puccinia coronata f. sp. avenae]|uniref:Uncharacterized protein n=1 Tax=Puccinia coronata f. sp. avenae TaxID=200324 RepID=A0A2N5UP96_9BASI|nr:hypothetical protein PCASD_08781 [Puccinia coronata f. sp. avenae]